MGRCEGDALTTSVAHLQTRLGRTNRQAAGRHVARRWLVRGRSAGPVAPTETQRDGRVGKSPGEKLLSAFGPGDPKRWKTETTPLPGQTHIAAGAGRSPPQNWCYRRCHRGPPV